jgi:hypothetical protein
MLNTNFARARIWHVIRHFYAVKTLDIYVLFRYYIVIQVAENKAKKIPYLLYALFQAVKVFIEWSRNVTVQCPLLHHWELHILRNFCAYNWKFNRHDAKMCTFVCTSTHHTHFGMLVTKLHPFNIVLHTNTRLAKLHITNVSNWAVEIYRFLSF